MSLEDNFIDDLFKKAFLDKKIQPYSPEYWDEFEQNLARRKKLNFMAVFSEMLFITLLLSLFLFNNLTEESYYNQSALNLISENVNSTNFDKPFIAVKKENKTSINNDKSNVNRYSNENNFKRIIRKETPNNISNFNVNTNFDSDFKNFPNIGLSIKISELPLIPFYSQNKIGILTKNEILVDQSNSDKLGFSTNFEIGAGKSQSYAENTILPTTYNLILRTKYAFQNVEFSSGIGLQIENNTNLLVSKRAQVYGFGVTNYEQTINYQTLLHLTIPIQASYSRNNLKYGVGMQLRMLSSSKLDFENKTNGITTESGNLSGITTGLNRINFDSYLFCERKLNERMNLGVKLSKQLTSTIRNENYFNNLVNQKSINASVYLTFKINN